MNRKIQLCLKCKLNPLITISNNNIRIQCTCGYNNTLTIKEYYNYLKRFKKNRTTKENQTFSHINSLINKGYEHIRLYFNELKIIAVNQLLNQIKELESSYEESYNRNKEMLSLLQILIKNYDGSQEMKSNIITNSNINIYKCVLNNRINTVIQYYNDYKIILVKEVNYKEIKEVKTIETHTKAVRGLLLLKDRRIASCSDDGTVKIYDPFNNYACDKNIKTFYYVVISMCEIDDGTIVAFTDGEIWINKFVIKKTHSSNQWHPKIISLPNNKIASCSWDGTVKIWKSNPPYSDKPIKVLNCFNKRVNSILYIKERDILISGSDSGILCLWNMSNYQYITVLTRIYCCNANSIYQFDESRIIVGYYEFIYIVNIDKCIVENEYRNMSLGAMNCFIKLRDEKTILCGCGGGIFCFYDIETKKVKIIKTSHNEEVFDLLLVDNETFLSCSKDKTIKLWKY